MRRIVALATAVCVIGCIGAGAVSAQDAEPWPSTTLKGAQAITSGHDRFVVVGARDTRKPHAKAWVSTDGLSWTRAPASPELAGAGMHAVTAVDDGFVALGSDASQQVVAWRSADGLTWERGTVKRPGKRGFDAWVEDLTDGPAGPMALGTFSAQDHGGNRLWHAPDGRTWKPVKVPQGGWVILEAIVGLPDGYLLIGHDWDADDSRFYWRSTDGETWEAVEGAPWMKDVAAAPDGTVAGIGISDIWTTADLETWEQTWQSPYVDGDPDEQETLWIGGDESGFAAHYISYGGCDDCGRQPLLLSDDGYAWVESDGPQGVPGHMWDTWMTDVASVGDLTVVLGGTDETAVAWLMPPRQ